MPLSSTPGLHPRPNLEVCLFQSQLLGSAGTRSAFPPHTCSRSDHREAREHFLNCRLEPPRAPASHRGAEPIRGTQHAPYPEGQHLYENADGSDVAASTRARTAPVLGASSTSPRRDEAIVYMATETPPRIRRPSPRAKRPPTLRPLRVHDCSSRCHVYDEVFPTRQRDPGALHLLLGPTRLHAMTVRALRELTASKLSATYAGMLPTDIYLTMQHDHETWIRPTGDALVRHGQELRWHWIVHDGQRYFDAQIALLRLLLDRHGVPHEVFAQGAPALPVLR